MVDCIVIITCLAAMPVLGLAGVALWKFLRYKPREIGKVELVRDGCEAAVRWAIVLLRAAGVEATLDEIAQMVRAMPIEAGDGYEINIWDKATHWHKHLEMAFKNGKTKELRCVMDYAEWFRRRLPVTQIGIRDGALGALAALREVVKS